MVKPPEPPSGEIYQAGQSESYSIPLPHIELGKAIYTVFDNIIRAIKAVVKFLKHLKPKRKVYNGVQFIQEGSKEKTNIFLGQTLHIPHVGECQPEMNCELSPIEKIIIKKNIIQLKAKDTSFTYRGVIVCTVFERKQ
jgi:hypothetical protein